MSDIDVEFKYESLDTFKSNGYSLPKEIQIIPVFHIKDSGDIFAVLVMNSTLCVKSFGTKYSKSKTIESFISDSIRYNSLNSIPINEEYVKLNSNIAYSTYRDVSLDRVVLNVNYSPIIFVDIIVENITILNNTIKIFKDNFSKLKSGILTSDADVVAMIYFSVEELFYLSRFTTYKMIFSGDVIDVDIEEQGFPARSDISDIYFANKSKGEIPVIDKYDPQANCSPEIEFYSKRDIIMSISICKFLDEGLPFMIPLEK